MAVNTQSARIKNHTSTTTGSFTVPASEDFTDGSWDKWDLAKSEIGVNEADDKVYIRIDSTIYELATVEKLPMELTVKIGDESTALTTGTKLTFFATTDMTLVDFMAGLTVQGTVSGSTKIDVHVAGTTVMTTDKIEIEYGEDTSLTATTPPAITTTSVTKGDKIEVIIDAVSGGAVEAGAVVTFYYNKA